MLRSAVIAAGLALAAATAQAATMKAVYTGTIRDLPGLAPSVADGMFGFAGPTSLHGEAFSATFVYDTRAGTSLQGPTLESVFSPDGRVILFALLRINGATFRFDDPVADFVAIGVGEDGTQKYVHTMNATLAVTGTAPFLVLDTEIATTFPFDLTLPLVLDVADGTGSAFAFATITGSASGWLDADRLTVAPIPLPATLPLALAGLAGLAFVVRGRRAV